MAAYEWLIGTRYLRSTQRKGFVSFIASITVFGLMLSVAVLIVVLSVMNGFERELRGRILSVTSHATLMGLDGPLPDADRARELALARPDVTAAVPYVESQSMLVHGERLAASQVRGIDPEAEAGTTGLVSQLPAALRAQLKAGTYRIILGDALAEELGVRTGDTLVLIAPQGTPTPVGVVPRRRSFEVAGTFHSGMYEFDRGLALMHRTDASRLFALGSQVTGLRLAVDDPYAAPRIVRELALELGGGFYVSDWTRNHSAFFRSIEMTKSMLFVILLMLIAVAAFNLIATLVMIVKEKQTDIAILRTLGAAPRNVLATFLTQGGLIGVIGVGLGIALGVLLAFNLESLVHGLEKLLNTRFLDERVYFMRDLPAQVEITDLLRIGGVALVLCALATLYPAWRAARTLPAEALRHD
ncbi:MAG: lipoprotein-releasing ABC transporter permease subunit [Steroidobacteraceae bacterium]